MIIDFSWSGGLVFGLSHTEEAIIELEDEEYHFTNAILFHLGFITMAIIFIPEEQQK